MKNYILAFMLVPFLLFGQKFKNSELITENKEGDKKGRSIAVETVPRLLSYQGFLTVGGAGPVSDGQYTVNFRLFDQEEDGNEFWNETHLLTISDGLVSALLGSNGFPIETVPMNSYLEIEIDGNTLSPRQQITSVMYAIKSDTTYFAKGYTKTADLSQVAMSGEYSDLLNSPDLTPFATKDSLGYYATLDSLDSYTLTSELSVVAFSGEYEDILNIPDLADYAVTDTLSYYATLDSLGYYVSEDSLFQYIGSTIQPYDTELQQIADLRDLEQGHLIVYDGTELTWTSQGGADARSALGLGDMAVQESDSVVITGGSISGIEDLTVSDGGTGASTSEGARDSLGLQIGVDVQGFDSDLQTIATQNHSENPNVKQMLISRGYYWEARSADSARIDLGLKIGQDVQAWNQDLQDYADGQDIPADKVQYGEYFINQPGQQGQIWGSDANEAGRWSNLGDYLTYEVTSTDSATSIEFDVDVGTGPNQVIALDVNQKLPAVNASRLVGITADQINDSTVSNSEFNMLSGVRTISGEDGPGGLIQDQLDNKAQKGNNTDILSITGLTTMLAINQGGTGASTAEDARTNLDAQQQNVHLDDLAEDGILSASKVQYGNFFVKDAGDAGFQWTSDGVDEGYWAPGGDIAHVYTTAGRGILINGATVAEAGSVKVEVDAGAAVGQIPQLEFSSNWEGGKLPAVDGSGLLHLNAEQINASSARPVTNAQFDLLTDLRTTSTADSAGGPIQAQLDNKQDQSIYLDDIVTASAGNVTDSDLLIWKVVDGDGSWELLASDDETYNVTASRVEHGEFFINDAGITGQYWSSDGSEGGEWRTYGPRFTVGADTLAIRTGTNAGDIVELVTGGKLPAVDGSLLREITALQINDSTVKNTEFNALAGLRLAGQDLPEENATEFRYQAGDIQVQLDGKMNYHANLADLVDGPLTYDLVQYGEYFIKEPSDLEGKVWTWSSGGFGDWVLPPGAQWIGDLNDASTSPANSNNLFLGALAGENPSGANNLGVGSGSLRYITSGNINVAVGTNAGSTIQTGNANVLIGNNAGSGLLSNADNKLIIDNGNSNLSVTNPLIGGSFDPDANRGVTVDGTLLSRDDLSTASDINIVGVTQDNSVNADLFTISENSGDINMTNYTSGQKINFVVDQNNTVLTLDGNDGMVKLPGTVKIASDDDVLTHINATNSGANLNVMGATKVFVRGGDASAGRIQLMAKDSLRLKSDNIEIDSPQEFIVQNDMRVGGKLTVGDTPTTEFVIRNDGSNDTHLENKIADKDIIFNGYPSGSVSEVMRIDGSGESLLMNDDQKLEFRDTGTYMHSTQSNTLALVAPSLNITSTSGVILDTDNHFQFRDAATYVASSASNVLDIVAPTVVASQSGTAAGTVYIGTGGANKVEAADATSMTVTSPILILDGSTRTSVQAELQLKNQLVFNDAEDELSIAETGTNDYTIKNLIQDKDIIVNANAGGADTEIARFDGSASSLLMAGTNKIEFTDVNHFINNSGNQLDIIALGDGTVKVGKFTDGDAPNNTATVKLEATTVNPNTNEFKVTAPSQTPVAKLFSDAEVLTTGNSLVMEKIRSAEAGQAGDILGNIMAKGENDADSPIDFTNINFRSRVVGGGSEQGSIEFVTKGADGDYVDNEILLDINQTTTNTVTVHKDLSIEGAVSLNGAAFKDDITSDLRGENNLGTDGTGEWASVNLYDRGVSNAKITFGDGSDATTDLHLEYDPSPAGNTQALMINRENRLQFRDTETYVASSASNVLDLVAPSLVITGSDIYPTAAGGTTIGTTDNEWGDLFLHEDKAIKFGSGQDATITHGGGSLTVLATNTDITNKLRVADEFLLGAGKDEFSITESSDDITIKNTVDDKDILFSASTSGSPVEIMRLDGSASSLLIAAENKIEFASATDYINAAGAKLNVRSNNPLWIDVSSIKMGNDLDTGAPDYAMVIEKDLASEVLTSNEASKPVWKLSNTNATAAQAGAIVEFSKTATEDNAIMGSIKSSTGDGTFAQIDFKGEGATNSQTGSMVFTTYDATVAKQVMDISATTANTVTIGTSGNDANLKVYGTLTAASTAYENDILPAVRGASGEPGIGAEAKEWADLWLTENGFIYFSNGDGAEDAADVKLTGATAANTGAQAGLILDGSHKFYFDDNTNYDQYIGSEGSGITKLSSVSEVEIDGGSLLDLKADRVTIEAEAEANGMEIKATLGDIALTTSAVGKKVTVNTNASAILSHTANGGAQDFTIEQVGAVDASLILNSAGTGTNAIALNASAGGMDIDATNSTLTITNTANSAGDHMTIAQAGAQDASLILSSAGTAADALTISTSAGGMDISVTGGAAGEDLDISTTNATTEMRLTSASSEADAIKLNASAGGIQIDAAAASNLTTSAGDLTIGGATQANAINIQSDESDAAAIRLNASDASGGIDMDAGGDIAINSTNLIITPVTLTSNVGDMEVKSGATDADPAELFITADRGEDNADKWLITAVDDGNLNIQTKRSGAWANALEIANDGTVSASSFSGGMSSGVISSDTDAANALEITTSAGGIDITAGGDTAGDDLDITATGAATEIRITSASTQGDAILMNASAGGIDLTSALAMDITTSANNANITIDPNGAGTLALGSADNTAVTVDAVAFSLDASDPSNITLAADAVDDDLTIEVTGAQDASLFLNSAGSGNDAIALTSSAGGMDLTAAKAIDITTSANDANITVTPNGTGTLALGAATNTAVNVDAVAFSLDASNPSNITLAADAANDDLTIEVTGAQDASLILNSAGTGANAIALNASAGGMDIDATNSTLTITNTADDAGDHMTIAQAGAQDASLILSSAGTAADALTISTSAGGIDITAGGDTAGDDLDITATGTATEIRITSASTQDDAIALTASAGGIQAKVANEKSLVLGNAALDSYFKLIASATPATQKIEIKNNSGGNAVDAIKLNAVTGGITIDAGGGDAATDDVVIVGNNFSVDADGAVIAASFSGSMTANSLTTDSEDLTISTTSSGNVILNSADDIDIDAAAGKDVSVEGGQVAIASKDDVGSAISLTTNIGTSETIVVTNTLGNTATAIHLNAAAGGVTVAANTTLTATGGGVSKFGDDVATLDFDGSGAVTETGMTNVTIDNSGTMTIQGGGVSKYGDDVATLDFDGSGAVTETGMTNVTIDNSGTMTMQGGGVSKFGDDTGYWSFDGSGAVTETGMTSVELTPSGAITLTAGAASTWSTGAGALTVDGADGVNIVGSGSEIDLTTDNDIVEINANTLAVKNGNNSAGSIMLYEDNDVDGDAGDTQESVKIQAPMLAASYEITLPVAAPTADGYVLKSTMAGVTTWELDLANNSQGTNTNVFGEPANDTDVSFTIDKATNDGAWYWMQSLDQFKFADDIMMDASEKLLFGGQNDYIHLDTDLKAVAAADFIVDAASEIILDHGAGTGIIIREGGADIGSIIKAAGNDLTIKSGATPALIFTGADIAAQGNVTVNGNIVGDADESKAIFAASTTAGSEITIGGGGLVVAAADLKVGGNDIQNSEGEVTITMDADQNAEIAAELTVTGAKIIVGADADDTDRSITFGHLTAKTIMGLDDDQNVFAIHTAADFTANNDIEIDADGAVRFNGAVTFAGGIADPGTVTTTDIDGGTIDGTVIGAATQAAGDFTAIGAVAPGTIVATTITANDDVSLVGDDGALQFTNAGENSIKIPDNQASALIIEQANIEYMKFITSDDDADNTDALPEEAIKVSKPLLLMSGSTEHPAIEAAEATDVAESVGIYFNTGPANGQLIITANNEDQFIFSDGFLKPASNAASINLGGSTKKFDDGFFSGEVTVGTLDIDGTDVTATAAELNIMDDATTQATVTLAAGDGVVIQDDDAAANSQMKQALVSDFATYVSSNITDGEIVEADLADNAVTNAKLAGITRGSIIYGDASGNPAYLGVGTVGQVLKSDGTDLLWGADGRPEAPPTPNSSSDRRFKKNISTVSGALQKLSKLNPVNYDWRQDEFENKGFNDKKQWGFIAQEIKEIFPELVGKDDEDFLTLNYQGFVPLLTKAVQEQQEEIDSQQKEIDALKSQLQMIMDMLDNDMSDKTDNKKDNDNKKPVKLSMVTQ